jgi:hypothetical protein
MKGGNRMRIAMAKSAAEIGFSLKIRKSAPESVRDWGNPILVKRSTIFLQKQSLFNPVPLCCQYFSASRINEKKIIYIAVGTGMAPLTCNVYFWV